MRLITTAFFVVGTLCSCPTFAGTPTLTAPAVTLGRDLQSWTTVSLSEPAPAGNLVVTITSTDPARLLLSKMPDAEGTPSLTLTVRTGFRETPEFWLQALADSGEVKYTATASGFEAATASATLTPSGFAIVGPFGEAAPPEFTTTPRGWPTKIMVRSVRLDETLAPVETQYVRGGVSTEVEIVSSDPKVGGATVSRLVIGAANDSAPAQFKPAAGGKTDLTIKAPRGFKTPSRLNSLHATVRMPGIAAANDVTIGENLQVVAALSLGEPAPEGGVTVTLASDCPDKVLFSTAPNEIGKPSIEVHVPARSVTTTYYVQALHSSGTITQTASAKGYLTRTGTLTLAPSGVILTPEKHGPPDEAELFRPESAGSHRNLFVALLHEQAPTPLHVFTAYLDPVSRRSADITVQALRAGLTLNVDLKNTDPGVGTVNSRVTINGGSDRGELTFTPVKVGQTVIQVLTPEGFTSPSNATELLALVKE